VAKNKIKKQEEVAGFCLQNDTKRHILAIVFFVLFLFFLMAMFGSAGVIGAFFYKYLNYFLGYGYITFPTLLLLLGLSFLRCEYPSVGLTRIGGSVMFLFSSLGIMSIISKLYNANTTILAGGILGEITSRPLEYLFDTSVSIIFLGAILIISILIIFDTKLELIKFFEKTWAFLGKIFNMGKTDASYISKKESEEKNEQVENEKDNEDEDEKGKSKDKLVKEDKQKKSKKGKGENSEEDEMFKESGLKNAKTTGFNANYVPPPLSLLEEDRGKPNTGDIKANANIIKRTLANFGIEVEMDEITVGPTVTRYSLKPAEGVKLSKIIALQNDLALALAAHPIRIEAPIPGKSLVGIEIPNRAKSIVGLATLLADDGFQNANKPLTIALGRGISGRASFGSLAKMPHCLIAGTTGAGKSVTIHSIITSLLYKNSPRNLKFIMIDPKRVELTLYNKIPHLLTPVITNAKNAILSLKWAAKEMDRRYEILEKNSARDIESYHKNLSAKLKESEKSGDESEKEENDGYLPYIVIIMDELADIMSAYPRELEAAIVRLAQMSRAVGIHLILSTQRPEVNVITGLIKANVPARVALRVSSQVDSRTILDQGGAEKLLGAGDILYSSGENQPERLQSAFISEAEVKKVVKYLIEHNQDDEVPQEIILTPNSVGTIDKSIFNSAFDANDSDNELDELYEEAKYCVLETKRASTSFLQRKLKLGYARAARLMDQLEEQGVIGPGDGAKPREVLGLTQTSSEVFEQPTQEEEVENYEKENPKI
jgi:S-DNA-T family DNA segregation ATPase FtsK/SpoIIIE